MKTFSEKKMARKKKLILIHRPAVALVTPQARMISEIAKFFMDWIFAIRSGSVR